MKRAKITIVSHCAMCVKSRPFAQLPKWNSGEQRLGNSDRREGAATLLLQSTELSTLLSVSLAEKPALGELQVATTFKITSHLSLICQF